MMAPVKFQMSCRPACDQRESVGRPTPKGASWVRAVSRRNTM